MRHYLILIWLLSVTLFVSCGDKDKQEPPVPKSIGNIIIAPERFVQKTEVEYYIAVRYGDYYDEGDKVTLTVNGQSGTLVKKERAAFQGTQLLFKLPPSNQTGDLTIKFVIDNGQKIVEQEQKLRFVTDYSLPVVWQSLMDEDYIKSMECLIRIDKQEFGGMVSVSCNNRRINNPPGFKIPAPSEEMRSYSLGRFWLTDYPSNMSVNVPFIPGISGWYIIEFGSALQALRIVHGELGVMPGYKAEDTHAEILAELGATFISNDWDSYYGYTIMTYKKGDFILKVHEQGRYIITLITKE
ncbi:MAG TPA: hypothetical protein PKA53_11410 [Sphingobacterium sp.]|nr:hypothetical protein [Sphingobacterium sp.]